MLYCQQKLPFGRSLKGKRQIIHRFKAQIQATCRLCYCEHRTFAACFQQVILAQHIYSISLIFFSFFSTKVQVLPSALSLPPFSALGEKALTLAVLRAGEQCWGLVSSPGWGARCLPRGLSPLLFLRAGFERTVCFPQQQVTLPKQLMFFTSHPLCHLSVDLSTQSVRIC